MCCNTHTAMYFRLYLEVSREVMHKLGYLDEYGDLAPGVSRTMCVAMWEVSTH
jgi:hypothetical protein